MFVFIGLSLEHMFVFVRCLSLYIYMAIWLYGVLAKCSDRICYIVARVVCVVCVVHMYVL